MSLSASTAAATAAMAMFSPDIDERRVDHEHHLVAALLAAPHDPVAGLREGLAEHVLEGGLHVELAGERFAQRLADDLRGAAQRADEPGGARQHGARRQPLGVEAQARVGDAAAAAREIDGHRPAVETLGRHVVALGERDHRSVAGGRLRPAGRQTPHFHAPAVPQARPAGGAQAFGDDRGRSEHDVRVLAALDDEREELVERGREVGVDVVAQVDARRQCGFGGAAQRLAVHARRTPLGPRSTDVPRWPPWRWRRAPRRPCGSAGGGAWRA